MDLKKFVHDPKYRLTLYLVVGVLAGLIGRNLGHPSQVHTPAEKLAELERVGFPPRMLIAVGLWVIPGIYWQIAARNPTAKKEPFRTRIVHLFLTSAAQLLVVLPIPGLRMRFLPLSPPIWVAGLVIEALAV